MTNGEKQPRIVDFQQVLTGQEFQISPGIVLDPNDRRMLIGLNNRLVAHGELRLGETTTDQSYLFSENIIDFASTAANVLLDKRENKQPPQLDTEPTDEQVAKSTEFERQRRLRFRNHREVPLPDGRTERSFTAQLIRANAKKFFGTYGYDRNVTDSRISGLFESTLQHRQRIVFAQGKVQSPAEQTYTAETSGLSTVAAQYPEIAITVRLRTLFRALGYHVEADAADVVLAAYGQKLLEASGQQIGATAVLNSGETPIQLPAKPEAVPLKSAS